MNKQLELKFMINLYVVGTGLESLEHLEKMTTQLVEELVNQNSSIDFRGYFNSSNLLDKHFNDVREKANATIIVNTSGGTEDCIKTITTYNNTPTLILADPKGNSFASSLESYAYLKENHTLKIGYGKNDSEKIEAAKLFCNVVSAIERIDLANFCLIGEPSNWLLTSKNFNGFGKFKTKFTELSVDEIVKKVNAISVNDYQVVKENWKSSFKEVLVDENSLNDSAKVYLALKEIAQENKADVLSVRCFDLLPYNYTACMGISLCNDEGITSGCEGDIPTTFTMMVAQYLSGHAVWMANPSSINYEKNEITFAHCTVPTSFLADISSSGLTTHMESNKSTAIRGPLNSGDVTIMRFSSSFDKLLAVKGNIIQSDMKDANLCRTQALIKIDGNVEKWMENTFGNHHVITYGNLIPVLEYFCDLTGLELVKI